MRWLALVGLFCACAGGTPALDAGDSYSLAPEWVKVGDTSECEGAAADPCLAPACTGAICALYSCEDLKPGRVVRTRGSLPARPSPDSQRYWGNAQVLPGGGEPVLIIQWYRPEELPSQQQARRILEAWRQRPKERHHIFPRAFALYFKTKGINIHEWVLMLDVAEHKRIHHGPNGGPWNQDWYAWIQSTQQLALQPEHFEQASLMNQKYNLWGLPLTYWQRFELPPATR
ncbi:TIGR02269 family lipoprotein [Pyxidicoccus sp. 3LFB2]